MDFRSGPFAPLKLNRTVTEAHRSRQLLAQAHRFGLLRCQNASLCEVSPRFLRILTLTLC
jgi:hypothetical protein